MVAASIVLQRRFLGAVLLLAVLTALSGVTNDARAAGSACVARGAGERQVLVGAELDNWEPVNDREVLIWTAHSTRADLVTLASSLAGLGRAAIIDLVDGDHDGSISPCGHDGIRLGGGIGGGRIVRIVSIQLLSERRTAELDPGAHVAAMDLART